MGFEPTTPTLARLCCANCGSAFNSNYMIARRVRPQRRTRAACGDPDLFFSACASASRAEDQAPRRVDGRRLSRALFSITFPRARDPPVGKIEPIDGRMRLEENQLPP